MTFQLYDAGGYVADLATASGLSELLKFLDGQDKEKFPSVLKLSKALYAPKTEALIKELDSLPKASGSLADTLEGFVKNARSCDEIIIIGDGLEEDGGQKAGIGQPDDAPRDEGGRWSGEGGSGSDGGSSGTWGGKEDGFYTDPPVGDRPPKGYLAHGSRQDGESISGHQEGGTWVTNNTSHAATFGEVEYVKAPLSIAKGNDPISAANYFRAAGDKISDVDELTSQDWSKIREYHKGKGYQAINFGPMHNDQADDIWIFDRAGLVRNPEGKSARSMDSEEFKATYWKMIDKRKLGWEEVVAKRVESLYKEDCKAVAEVIEKSSSPKRAVAKMERAIKERTPEWNKILSASLIAVIEDIGKHTTEGISPKSAMPSEAKFDPFTAAAMTWLKAFVGKQITTIQATFITELGGVIIKGYEDELSAIKIGSLIMDFFGERGAWMALRVSRTEVASAAGFGQREAAKQSGVINYKRWLSSRDDRVRDSHQEIDGEEQPLDEPYSNGLMYPGDSEGEAKEVIQCRCVEQYITKREPEGGEE